MKLSETISVDASAPVQIEYGNAATRLSLPRPERYDATEDEQCYTLEQLIKYGEACRDEAALAVPDAEIDRLTAENDALSAALRFISSYQARICWNREGDSCRVWRVKDEDNEDSHWEPMTKASFDTHMEAIDAAMKGEAA